MGCAPSAPQPVASANVQVEIASASKAGQRPVSTPLFFPDAAFPCHAFLRGQRCTRRNCRFAHEHTSLSRLLGVLDSAKRTLEVCVFTITCNEIAYAIEAAAKRGVMVRIISDDEQAKSKGSDVAQLAEVPNVTARHDGDTRSHMHHKFAIVDGETLINGSFNWTRAAVQYNRENVVIHARAPELVHAFRGEFNKMWLQYAANTRIPHAQS